MTDLESCKDCDNNCGNGCGNGCDRSACQCPGAGSVCDCQRTKLHSFNYLADIPGGFAESNYVEVQFKNARKGYYLNSQRIPLEIGDMVAVEAQPGHDIGMVSLTGALVELRMKKAGARSKESTETRRVFRKAKDTDIEKYNESKAREDDTMIRSRKIAESLKLNMKIGDVEYQGDGNKAIFYYIADERVDFRQLIKVLADTFKVRIEMRQIGARQEAGRIGGIGPCGRPLCCSQWMTNFVSVSTSAARYQDISMNPQKLAGQCAKLKCCLNFEVDAYVEASRKMPPREVRLESADATYYHFKSDVFNRTVTYSTDRNTAANLVTLSAERVFEIIELNKAGEKPASLLPESGEHRKKTSEFGDILGQDDLTRFDRKKKKRSRPAEGDRQRQARSSQGAQEAKQQKTPQKRTRPTARQRHPAQRMKHLPAVIAAIMLAMLAACSHFAPDEADGSCSAFSTFGDRGWRYFDTLTLAADSTADSIRHGALILNLRHSTAYPWRNIWLELSYPDGTDSSATMARDTFDIVLADRYGRWRGSGMGSSLQLSDTLHTRFAMRRGQRVSLRHIMRTDTLPAIERAGLIFQAEQR